MHRHARLALLSVTLLLPTSSCGVGEPDPGQVGAIRGGLTDPDARRMRAARIRDVAAGRGLTNGLLLAGIADSETSMSHCWSELTWACQGPTSPDCGGPVVAGAADGPCSDEQGGLGMFQFDAGTYDDTLAREGEAILTLDGNIDAGVDFVIAMVKRSTYIEGVDTDEQALAWMNEVRPWNDMYPTWIQTVTHYYNGCVPGSCSVYDSRYAGYRDTTTDLVDEMGEDFWYADVTVPECESIPPDGRVVDETDPCFDEGGTSMYWRRETTGWGDSLQWTHTTDSDAVDNYGVWQLQLDEGGDYLVEVYTDAAFAQSRQAAYRVTHAGVTDVVTLDQSAADGFQTLGTFGFAAGGEQQIRLDDNTGEPYSTRTQIVFDAVRLTPLGAVADGGVPPGSDGGTADAGAGGGDAGPTGPGGGKVGGGCTVSGAQPPSAAAPWLLAMALLYATARRRRP